MVDVDRSTQMSVTTAIGVLTDECGAVAYYLEGDYYVGVVGLFNNTYNDHLSKCGSLCDSVDEFFSQTLFEKEHSDVRYLMLRDQSVVFQVAGDTSIYRISKGEDGIFDLQQKKH